MFELTWRGGVYGAMDALLLTVIPCLVVYRSLGGGLATWRRRLAYFAVSLALVMTIDPDAAEQQSDRLDRRSRGDARLGRRAQL